MNNLTPCLIAAFASSLLAAACPALNAENTPQATLSSPRSAEGSPSTQNIAKKPFSPFTGKVTKSRVRLRLLPNLDGTIIAELNQGMLLLIVDENEDFYTVEPLADSKAYVFRTYVLDNVIEGSHVNVRLKPDTESPVVTQLNSGDRVEGIIHPTNNKWLEIAMPKSVRFYVAKDYIERVGDRFFLAKHEKRQQEVNQLLNETQKASRSEMSKPFEEIHIEGLVANYKQIIEQYTDFPDQGLRAKDSLGALQNAYAQKKLAYLESHQGDSKELRAKYEKLALELKNHQNQVNHLKQQLQKTNNTPVNRPSMEKGNNLTDKMSQWIPNEQSIYSAWAEENGHQPTSAFYNEQKKNAIILSGILETYNRPVKNKPGDYLLVNTQSQIPSAFLYSTHVNLQDLIGQEITIIVAPRPNNNYAFPAYYVLEVK